jgi:cytochrome c oxidase subunit 2
MNASSGGSLDPQGPVAESMAELFWVMTGLGTAVFLAFLALLALGLARRRHAAATADTDDAAATADTDDAAATADTDDAAAFPGPVEETERGAAQLVRRWIVVGGVVVPLLVIVVVFGATLRSMRAIPTDAPSDALVVEVTANQFWWEIHYPEQDVTTANEMYVPVGRPIAIELTSTDVIHSFWVPALGGKRDALPDGINTLVIEADAPGEHATECAEFCGLQHAQMGLLVVAEPADAFEDWIDQQQQPAAEPVDAEAERGREVFLGSDCATCHAVRGTPAEVGEGPDLTHLASRRTLAADALPNTPENLADWVTDPQAIKPGVQMPAAELGDDELDALLTYLGGLR